MKGFEVCLNADDLEQLQQDIELIATTDVQRVELCGAMEQQGLTPSVDAISLAKSGLARHQELLVMIRPRGGNFHYQTNELQQMALQIDFAAHSGADGVVFGVVDSTTNRIDISAMDALCVQCHGLNLAMTFHRGFDLLSSVKEGISQLKQLGMHRVLSSGMHWLSEGTAWNGRENLRLYARMLEQDIELVIGGGINAALIPELSREIQNDTQRFSFHSYSDVMTDNRLDRDKIQAVLSACQSI